METLTIDNEILAVWKTLSLSQKHSVIQLIHSFKEEEAEWTMDEIQEYNTEIGEAEQRIANGQFTTHEDVIQSLEKWK